MVSNCAQTNGVSSERTRLTKSFSEAVNGRRVEVNGESVVPGDER